MYSLKIMPPPHPVLIKNQIFSLLERDIWLFWMIKRGVDTEMSKLINDWITDRP